jgi:ABC-2 type transport system permease protein
MKFFTDTFLLLKRHLMKNLRMPIWLFIGLMQPILYLLLYMPLLKNLSGNPGIPTGEVVRIFVPGMLIIMGLGALFAGFGFIGERRLGIIERWLVTPSSRLALLTSFILANIAVLFVHVFILLVIALFFGLKAPFWGIVLTLLLLMFISIASASISYTVALSVKDESGLASAVNTFFLPIMLLSGIMLPIALAPQWLKTAAHFNPFYYAVEASRALFAGNFSDPIVFEGFAVMIALAVLAMWLAVRALRRMAA